jgi:polyphosphate kinase 2 (PPK2 family)
VFETAELGQKVSKKEYKQRLLHLREALLLAQVRMREAKLPVVVLFAGVDGAGKGDTANLLNEWLDPRWILTRAYREPSQEEAERPPFWRYWRDLPPKGSMGIYLSAWYSHPLIHRAHGHSSAAKFEEQLDEILRFEKTLADDGALILKFWMHLGKKAQEKRLRALEKDPLQAWRVTERDWQHWRMYEQFVTAAEEILQRTSTGSAPWILVEGADPNYRSLRVGDEMLQAISLRLDEKIRLEAAAKLEVPPPIVVDQGPHPAFDEATPGEPMEAPPPAVSRPPATVLSTLDLSKKLDKKTFQEQLTTLQGQLNLLHRKLRERGVPVVMAFEGWDAAGKGGSIRRIVTALDARSVRVHRVAAPSSEELAQHYLWRFWRQLPRAGEVAIFDRSVSGSGDGRTPRSTCSNASWPTSARSCSSSGYTSRPRSSSSGSSCARRSPTSAGS